MSGYDNENMDTSFFDESSMQKTLNDIDANKSMKQMSSRKKKDKLSESGSDYFTHIGENDGSSEMDSNQIR